MKLSANYTEFSGHFCHTHTQAVKKERGRTNTKIKKIQENENLMLKNEVFFSLLEFEKIFTLTSYKLQSNVNCFV